ncbi:conserved hypothetical protein [Paecilomyces variotii No. 5]|uniref:protein-histidine N-methyltransferase n=1 Tax=Byssochlamys spectabilis (strain No. 5 / NBRC 109023) TaxID=1356009 RepID=V5HT57_BYSSN|nr:conserved hypothetical protein [Paecilomyces variotii No. 5]
MASGFTFGFSGDDVDIDESDAQFDGGYVENQDRTSQDREQNRPLIEAKRWDGEEWLSTLPSQISYNKLSIPSSNSKDVIALGRREVFDIRTQLMAEDDNDNDELISGLEEGDLRPNFYEGGFKTWECALDLAKMMAGEEGRELLDDNSDAKDVHIIEVGAGSAMPSLSIFAQLLSRPKTHSSRRVHFTFADYNDAVLRLVTVPNLLLTWKLNSPNQTTESTGGEETDEKEEEELDTDPSLIESFRADLRDRSITIDFISGAWSPEFVELALTGRQDRGNNDDARSWRTLILASETIYSPSSLGAFSETLLSLLRRCGPGTTAGSETRGLVAAKKVYFGVGGGVDEFLAVLNEMAGQAVEVQQRVEVKTEGVGRVVLQVKVAS